jgi:hypothetical protein
MKTLIPIPYFLNAERTPLVDQLLDILKERDDYIRDLEEELRRTKKLPAKPKFDKLKVKKEKQTKTGKRPGSSKKKKTKNLIIHETHILKVEDKPVDAKFKGYRNFAIQDISIELKNRMYQCERWQLANGTYLQAKLPKAYEGQHFGPYLRSYILHQVYHQGVTRNLLLSQLHEWGIKISEGQLNNILLKNKDVYHDEKNRLLESGCRNSSYIQADDTGARHRGKNGYCTYIGNEHFAFYKSNDKKNRYNFLNCFKDALPETIGLQLDKEAFHYLKWNKLSPIKLINILSDIETDPHYFLTEADLKKYLTRLGIHSEHELQLCCEAGLFSSLKRFLFTKEIFLMTDEAGQFRLPKIKHTLCWLHIERKFKQLLPHTEEQATIIANKREKLWLLYKALKTYQLNPIAEQKTLLRQQFFDLCSPVENEKSLNEVLSRIKRCEKELLITLNYPFLPLHNNTSENDIREMVRRRKVSGGTRHDLGRECRDTFISLKRTCKKVGVTFWDYLLDRTLQKNQIKPLSDYVQSHAFKNRVGEFENPIVS